MNESRNPAGHDASPLDEVDLAFLGEALAPIAPADRVRERILSQVLARVALAPVSTSGPTDVLTLRADDGAWVAIGAGASQRVLHDDGRFRTLLVRLEAGASLPPHEHPLEEECFVIEGDIWLSGEHMRRGDYQRVAAGIPHLGIRSEGGCLLHVRASSVHG
jgi:quercetin dioxygenase-like cupin family protein